MTQYGFFFDQSRCSGCHTCTIACKSVHQHPPGPLKYLRIYQYEKGAFPNVRVRVQWMPCYHCEEPACIDVCSVDAIYKENNYGAVIIDTEECIGCRQCYDACPYGALVFESDETDATAQKCDMCIDRLDQGEAPICVLSCPLRALDFGPMKELEKKYGNQRDLCDLPDSSITKPAVVFKPSREKPPLFPYDSAKALKLLMNRDPLPPIFSSSSDVIAIPEGLVGRNMFIFKHASCEELMKFTRNDEG